MKKILAAIVYAAIALSLCLASTQAQGVPYSNIVLATNPPGGVVPYATIRVCQEPASGTPCTPLANIFSNQAMTQPLSNPFTASATGYYQFFAAPGFYHVQVSGPNVAQTDLPYILLPGNSTNGVQTVAFSSTPSFNAGAYGTFLMALTGNVTSSSITGQTNGQIVTFEITQDATGGRTFAWPTNVSDPPTVNTSPNATTVAQFQYNGTNWVPTSGVSQTLNGVTTNGGTITGGAVNPSTASIGALTATSPAITPTSIEGVEYADQFCTTPGTLDQSCIQGALNAIGLTQATLFIPSGNYAIGANLTIPSNVTLQFARGAIWTVAVPYVVEINGPLLAGNYQIFNTTLPTQTTGSMTSGSATLTTTGLSAADVGSAVYVAGASGTAVSMPVNDYLGMGVGNGTQTTFTYTAAHVPMNANSVQVSDAFTRGVDNGSGIIEPPFWPLTGITGTVNYTTGAVSVTFATAPASGTIIEIDYTYNQNEPLTGTITSVTSSTSATVSFNAANTTSNAQVMFGGSYVKFGSGYISSLNPMWWGAIGDASTDSTAALQASMTACGEAQLPLSVPTGTYITNATLDVGDPFQLGFYDTTFAIVGGSCSIVGQRGGVRFGQQKVVTFQAGASFPSGAYILQRENADGIDWEYFYVNGGTTGANGIDATWSWIGGTGSPDIKNVFQFITIENYGRMGALLDNCNGCTLRDVNIAQSTATVPIALQLEGGGGKIDLFQSSFYNGVVRLGAQNGDVFGGGFYDGLDLTGVSSNDFAIQGTQIFTNANTGIALDSTNTSGEGTDLVTCTECWFNGGSGQSLIAGRWGRELRLVGDAFYPSTSGTPAFFGTIASGITPTFEIYGFGFFGNVSLSTPNLGNVIQHTGYNTSATITSAPMDFESLTAPTNGFLCLGSGTCNSTTNYAIGGDGGNSTVYLAEGYSAIITPATVAVGAGAPMTSTGAGGVMASTSQLPLAGSVAGSTAALAAQACGDVVTATITGATTSMVAAASVQGALPQSGLVVQAAVTGDNTVSVEYCNVTAVSITPAAATVEIRVVQ